ncbi:MAG: hypothetical protein KZQ76_02465 [Candidatus Thiodiazotropha sp. (ex Epidulcina cf. delphinae)]|nr:hypothetical protein [Candidatus Thiodiazotropha sp. (ex Epidulcina cf. delphinae)]
MNDKKIKTLDNVHAFLEGTAEIDFSIEDKDECYCWIRTTRVRFRYLSLGKTERGLVLRYLERVSGYSRQGAPRSTKEHQGAPSKENKENKEGSSLYL